MLADTETEEGAQTGWTNSFPINANTQKPELQHENAVLSREGFVLLCPVWAVSDSSSTSICNDWNEHIYSKGRKKHNIHTGVVFPLSIFANRTKRDTDTVSFPHASRKTHSVPTFLTIAFCLSFLMFSNLSVKVASFSQSHMPILPEDKSPSQNNRQRFCNCHKIKPILK